MGWFRRFALSPLQFSVAITITGTASACGDPLDRFVERVDSAGVEIVRNTGGDRPLRWRFEARGGVSDYVWVDALDVGRGQVGADRSGQLYLLDRARARVAVFDSSGRYLRSIGDREGVEERLDTPVSITVGPDGDVRVFDTGLARILEFSAEGGVVSQLVMPPVGWDWRVVSASDGFVGVRGPVSTETSDSNTQIQRLMAVTASDTLELAKLVRVTATFTLPACGLTVTAEPLFHPRLVWDAAADVVAVSSEADYVVNVFTARGLSRSIRRTLPARFTNDSTAAEEVGHGLVMATQYGHCGGNVTDEVRRRGFAPVLPAVHAISLAPDGTMWVVRGHFRTEDPAIDVFGTGGAYLGTLPAGSPVPVGFTPSGQLLAVERGEKRGGELVGYSIGRRR